LSPYFHFENRERAFHVYGEKRMMVKDLAIGSEEEQEDTIVDVFCELPGKQVSLFSRPGKRLRTSYSSVEN
jgi:hypothetical protein